MPRVIIDGIIGAPFSLRTGTAPAVDLIRLGSFRDIFGHCDRLYKKYQVLLIRCKPF